MSRKFSFGSLSSIDADCWVGKMSLMKHEKVANDHPITYGLFLAFLRHFLRQPVYLTRMVNISEFFIFDTINVIQVQAY